MTRHYDQGAEILFAAVVLGVVCFICGALLYALFLGMGLL